MACTPYVDCDNKIESLESIFKRLIVVQEDGSLAIRGCCDGDGSTGCNPYVDCDHRHGWPGLFKNIIVMRADNTFAIRACG